MWNSQGIPSSRPLYRNGTRRDDVGEDEEEAVCHSDPDDDAEAEMALEALDLDLVSNSPSPESCTADSVITFTSTILRHFAVDNASYRLVCNTFYIEYTTRACASK